MPCRWCASVIGPSPVIVGHGASAPQEANAWFGYAVRMSTRHEDLIAAASDILAQAGIVLTWTLPPTEGEPHTFTAIQKTTRECWKVTGTVPMQALAEIMEQCGFEGLL